MYTHTYVYITTSILMVVISAESTEAVAVRGVDDGGPSLTLIRYTDEGNEGKLSLTLVNCTMTVAEPTWPASIVSVAKI